LLQTRVRRFVAVLWIGCLVCSTAAAGEWPKGPVRVVVPFPAGGGTDLIARVLADRLSAQLNSPFHVENRPGASGAIAAELVAASPPDGSVLFVAAVPQIAVLPVLQPVRYDPQRDFAPVSNIASSSFILVARSDLPARTIPELVQLAKNSKLTYGSGSNGSLTHIAAAVFARRAGIELLHVPFQGGAPAMAAVQAGTVDLYFANASEAIAQSASPRIRILAVSSPARMALLPQVPAVAEFFPGFDVTVWTGLFGPAGLPPSVVELLARHSRQAVVSPATQAHFARLGIDPVGSDTPEFVRTIDADIRAYRRIIPENGIRIDR
jgi:tripartite-type tricarboxylate transporter receptor subunit TctC